MLGRRHVGSLSRSSRRVLAGGGGAFVVFVVLLLADAGGGWKWLPLGLAVGSVVYCLVAEIPRYQVRRLDRSVPPETRFESENEARKTLVQLLTGVGVVATVAVTLYQTSETRRTSQRTLDLTAEAQVTERLSRTVEQLSHTESGSLTARIGGIYTLEKMGRVGQLDRQVVGDILSAYIQSHSPAKEDDLPESESTGAGDVPACTNSVQATPDRDIQVALEALSGLREQGPIHIDLSGTNLEGISLRKGRLQDAVLTDAVLVDADLLGADLTNAHLTRADLDGACLRNAVLRDVSVAGASFDYSTVKGATFEGSCTTSASSRGADGWEEAQAGTTC